MPKPGSPLPGEADDLALADALRNLHAERVFYQRDAALGVELRCAQGELARGAAEAVLELEQDARVVVVAPRMRCMAWLRPTLAAHPAENLGEELAELRGFGGGRKSCPGECWPSWS